MGMEKENTNLEKQFGSFWKKKKTTKSLYLAYDLDILLGETRIYIHTDMYI